MCGIAGLVYPRAHDDRAGQHLERMLQALHHREPDDRGGWTGVVGPARLALGATRLAILDLSPAGRQPMVDPDSGCVLVYNGEVYNFEDLRAELSRDGQCTFVSSGDTEVILKSYLRWGPSFVRRLRGMFALALFDPRARRLILVRDHLGIKPLYMANGLGGEVAFASEVRALLELPWIHRSLDPLGLMSYLAYGSVQDPYTLISAIRSIPAAHTVTIDLGTDEVSVREPEPFWCLSELVCQEPHESPRDSVRRVYATLAESVRRHLVSDVPVGVFLSGGINSSSIVALMAESGPSRVQALTVSLEDTAFDESAIARSVAARYGVKHTEIKLTGADFLNDLPVWLAAQDLPSGDGANTWVVSRACKEAGVTVALSGLGGDELFAGYPTFRHTLLAARLMRRIGWVSPRIRSACAAAMRASRPRSVVWQKLAEIVGGELSNVAAYLVTRRMFLPRLAAQLVHPAVETLAHPTALHPAVLERLERGSESPDTIAAVSVFELTTYLVNTLLRDSDQMGMAHSLEIRVPFVDRAVVELVCSLPGAVRLAGRGPKPLLCEAMGDRLDDAWTQRPKMTFSFPFDTWLRGPLRHDVGQGLNELSHFPFRPHAVTRLWEEFLGGRSWINGGRILTLYALASWIKRHRVEGGP